MSSRSFRPQLEELGSRILPSANPAISISDVALAEGHSGQTAFVFTVRLSEASSREVSVKYATANGSAKTGDGDFVGKSGTLKFAPGETTKTITVMVNGDAKVEADEQFFVNLSVARNAVIADAQGVGTILNDDPPPLPCTPSTPCGDPDSGQSSGYYDFGIVSLFRDGDVTVRGLAGSPVTHQPPQARFEDTGEVIAHRTLTPDSDQRTAGGSLRPHRPGTALALGLRAGSVLALVVPQTALFCEELSS